MDKRNKTMKKVAILPVSLAVALVLVMVLSTPAMAVVESVGATVTVNAVISFTVQDSGDAGLTFGSLTPGSSNNPELAQTGRGAVVLSLGIESNVDCDISMKAGDFTSGSNTFSIDNARWNAADDASGATAMTNNYAKMTTLSANTSQDIWHWLSVPAGQMAGTYTTDFYYQSLAVAE